jgi:hypothetical protein
MFASNHHQIFRPSSSLNNENVTTVLPSKNSNGGDATGPGTVSKTPAASGKQRRALGDISNRKGTGATTGLGNSNKHGNAAVLPKKTQATPRLAASSSSKKNKTSSAGIQSSAVLPRTQVLKPSSKSVNILPVPNEMSALRKATETKTKVTFEEPVDDIEKPAGRLWEEQLAYDDDDSSEVSLSLLPGAATLKEDWAAANMARYQRRLQQLDDAEQREEAALDEMVAKQLQEDGKLTNSRF